MGPLILSTMPFSFDEVAAPAKEVLRLDGQRGGLPRRALGRDPTVEYGIDWHNTQIVKECRQSLRRPEHTAVYTGPPHPSQAMFFPTLLFHKEREDRDRMRAYVPERSLRSWWQGLMCTPDPEPRPLHEHADREHTWRVIREQIVGRRDTEMDCCEGRREFYYDAAQNDVRFQVNLYPGARRVFEPLVPLQPEAEERLGELQELYERAARCVLRAFQHRELQEAIVSYYWGCTSGDYDSSGSDSSSESDDEGEVQDAAEGEGEVRDSQLTTVAHQ